MGGKISSKIILIFTKNQLKPNSILFLFPPTAFNERMVVPLQLQMPASRLFS